MKIKNELIGVINKTFEKLGAPLQVLCAVGSIGDTLSDDEVIEQLESFCSGEDNFKVICQSDDSILFDAEQASKRNANRTEKILKVIKVSTPDGKEFFNEYDPDKDHESNLKNLKEKTHKYLNEQKIPDYERGKTVYTFMEMSESEYSKIPISTFWN